MDEQEEREFARLLAELKNPYLHVKQIPKVEQYTPEQHSFAQKWSTLLEDPMKLIDVDLEIILGFEMKNLLNNRLSTVESDGKHFWKGVIFAGLVDPKNIKGHLPQDALSQHLAKLYPNHKVEGGPCRAVVNDDRFVYRCLDCMVNQGAIMCPGCYDKDRHENNL